MWDMGARDVEVRGRAVAVTVAALVLLIIVQLSVIAPLDLPLGSPDVVLIVLTFVALARGPLFGAIIGFVVGLIADLLSTHVLGQTTMIFCLIGYGVGLTHDEAGRTVYLPMIAAAAASALGTAGQAALAGILGNASLTGGQVFLRSVGAVLYALVLTPLLFPLVTAGMRRLYRDDS